MATAKVDDEQRRRREVAEEASQLHPMSAREIEQWMASEGFLEYA
ncbi:MAG TPA: hypothetical protein VKS22_10645 [Candidatus Binataceae bacterium]|nr:hypothetical protein [Candidatus Binataceae bacterium]